MRAENTVDKVKLISELKDIHSELFQVYKKLFDFKYKHDEAFKLFIDNEYKENGVVSKEKKVWNDNFCHRASYTLLNKILFVRICEDKGFMRNAEDYIAGEVKDPHIGEKLSKVGLQKWGALVTNYTLGELIKFAFDDMKQSYSNIVLYKQDKYEILNPKDEEFNLKYIEGDKDTKELVLEFEKVLNDIIEKLDTNNFNFKYTDGNILGDVYEKFMDRETRKAIGQFYTPGFVIEYILKNTVAEADVVENPFVTVADISCGSGHFLIMAYDILREKFLGNLDILKEKYADKIYTIKKYGKEIQLTGNEYWVKEHVHYHILKHCIYGADIDSFAVQLTTINLLLKDLDNFTDELNIIECDSLIKWEEDYDWKGLKEQLEEEFEVIGTTQSNLFGEEEKIEIKQRKENYKLKYRDLSGTGRLDVISREKAQEILDLCEFWENRFDYVVGNPPYGSEVKSSILKDYYMRNYSDVHMRTIDVYNYFNSRATKKIIKQLGYIIPSTLLTQYEYTQCRKYMMDNYNIKRIINLGENVFDDNSYPTIIIILSRYNDNEKIKILDISNSLNNEEKEKMINDIKLYKEMNQKNYEHVDNYKFLIIDEKFINLMVKIKSKHKKLIDFCDNVSVGIASGNDKAFVIKSNEFDKVDNILLKKLLVGGDINRYYINYSDKYILYINRETDMDNLNNTIEHLSTFKEQLSSRREAKKGIMRWYELHWPRNSELFESKKVICRQTGDELIATVDKDKYYTLNSIIDIVLKKSVDITEEYICAILNSKLMNVYYQLLVQENGKLFAEVKPVVVKELPIPYIDKFQIENINELVLKIMDLNLQNKEKYNQFLVEKDILNNYIKNTDMIEKNNCKIIELDQKLNNEIYKLFGMDEEAIELIEEYYNKRYNIKPLTNQVLEIDFLKNEHVKNNLSLMEVSKKFGVKLDKIIEMRNSHIKNKYYEVLDLYSLANLYKSIDTFFIEIISKFLANNNKKYMRIAEFIKLLDEKISNYYEYIDVLRNRTSAIRKTQDIIKDSLSKETYTWNAYRKDKAKDKVSKTFVKYYDNNYYGLSEWSDEIHKQYFMDAIDEYTVNNPNEKKAKDILKLFLDLDIEDKEDYIDVIEGKIKRAFN
ncbi:N-6 DNA Methylase [Clostridium amylolyticum]|uniref:site-specific DNA-methyltransferase (adenine-specific) n=1 Tax=Clostridium amylolyticum TaxID=1121298 RepID=A0A1M6KES3_9CLOT|nr:TaqI-like C-terminal specificity domain-containing protein [Clostridium amylolyticum]SHJ57327.1 N-6 DNA Methylase [Clostridium amylolyticum]